jgi:hypothetical protein
MAKDFMTINPVAARQLAAKSSVPTVIAATEKVATRARLLAPGTMKHKIRPIVSTTGAGGLGIIMVDHPAVTFVLYGTRPHVIVARNKKVLKFKVDNRDVFARRVNHPGTKANNFLWKALEASRIF